VLSVAITQAVHSPVFGTMVNCSTLHRSATKAFVTETAGYAWCLCSA